MYKLIKAKPAHAEQIIPYLAITCYWKEFAEGNSLNQSYEELMLQWVVNPRLPYTTVLVKEGDENTIYGCIIAATTDQLATMPDYSPVIHPRVIEVFGEWFQFPVTDGVMVELIAVAKELRGQGYGAKLYQVAEDLAKAENKENISAFVWACFPDSLITFTRRGFMVTDCVTFSDPAIIKAPLLYVQKQPEYVALKDYFQSKDYISSKNILLS